jgi:DNA-3-methyladenine glycosylase II
VEKFGGRPPSPAEFLGADAQDLRGSGMSARKVATLRAIAERFVDGRLSEEVMAEMSDDEVEAVLTEVPGVGPWTAHGFLLIALNRPDVFLPGDVALRRAVQQAYGYDYAPQSWRWTKRRSAGDRIEA